MAEYMKELEKTLKTMVNVAQSWGYDVTPTGGYIGGIRLCLIGVVELIEEDYPEMHGYGLGISSDDRWGLEAGFCGWPDPPSEFHTLGVKIRRWVRDRRASRLRVNRRIVRRNVARESR